ncbi:hypothetical protein LWM68_25725 [Niabella sp. W65]|nr:hypothetical protein [Niabella sp. W65]MCH7365866.1 hypothetical protein [Niabella sp. W65]
MYNEDGSLYYFTTSGTDGTLGLRPSFNVLNEMNHTGQTLDGSSYTAVADINYQLMHGLQLKTVLSYTSSNTEQQTWFGEKTNWVDVVRGVYPSAPAEDPIPLAGSYGSKTLGKTLTPYAPRQLSTALSMPIKSTY